MGIDGWVNGRDCAFCVLFMFCNDAISRDEFVFEKEFLYSVLVYLHKGVKQNLIETQIPVFSNVLHGCSIYVLINEDITICFY